MYGIGAPNSNHFYSIYLNIPFVIISVFTVVNQIKLFWLESRKTITPETIALLFSTV